MASCPEPEERNKDLPPPSLLSWLPPSNLHPTGSPCLPPKERMLQEIGSSTRECTGRIFPNLLLFSLSGWLMKFNASWPTPYLPAHLPSPAWLQSMPRQKTGSPLLSLPWTLFTCHLPAPQLTRAIGWRQIGANERKLPDCLGSEITGTALLSPQGSSVTMHTAQDCSPIHLLPRYQGTKYRSKVTIHAMWFCRKTPTQHRRITIFLEEILSFESHYILTYN